MNHIEIYKSIHSINHDVSCGCEGLSTIICDDNKKCTRCKIASNHYGYNTGLCWRSSFDSIRRRFVCLKCKNHWSSKSTFKPFSYYDFKDYVEKNYNDFNPNSITFGLSKTDYNKYKKLYDEYTFFEADAYAPCSWRTNDNVIKIPNCSCGSPKVREIGPTLRLPSKSKKKEWEEIIKLLSKLSNYESVVTFEYKPSKRFKSKKKKNNSYMSDEYIEKIYKEQHFPKKGEKKDFIL